LAKEIERKFLVTSKDFLHNLEPTFYQQGYIPTCDNTTVRLRVIGDKAFLTIKGENQGITRLEFEYEIPLEDAKQMMNAVCSKPMIEKFRYICQVGNTRWEVDRFVGDNDGLVVAEVELNSESQEFDHPDWLGREVSGDAKYYNSQLVKHPYSKWTTAEKLKS